MDEYNSDDVRGEFIFFPTRCQCRNTIIPLTSVGSTFATRIVNVSFFLILLLRPSRHIYVSLSDHACNACLFDA